MLQCSTGLTAKRPLLPLYSRLYIGVGTSLCVHLRLDVLLRSSDKAGTAEPQHDHDGQEETGRQNPAWKA